MQESKNSLFRNMIRRMRRFIDLLEIYGVLWSKERRYTSELSFFKRLRAWRLGFLSDSYVQYFRENGEKNVELFLTDYQRWRYVPRINAKYGIVLADKFLFRNYFQNFSQHIPEIFFFTQDGKLFTPDFTEASFETVVELARAKGKMILKPRSGFGGRGIIKVVFSNGHFVVNKHLHTEESFLKFLKTLDGYLFTQFATQEGYAYKIYPNAVNSLRILTVIDPDTHMARIAGISHRFGSDTTGAVDNWTSGGISAAVDVKTGIMGKCAQNPKGKDLLWLSAHPDTKEPITGVQIPNWPFVVSQVLAMANACKYCPYIGWDIAVSADTFWVLEANDSPDVHIIQIHEPLFSSPENRRFYSYHNVIR
jgi:hypothetical protein